MRWPSASANNWYGVAKSSSQCPNNTHAPPSNATLAASAISVVLPTPASPLTTTTSRPPSAPTRLTQSPTTTSSALRPTTPTAGRTASRAGNAASRATSARCRSSSRPTNELRGSGRTCARPRLGGDGVGGS